jgi:DNA-3-methyladenine glycosylase I
LRKRERYREVLYGFDVQLSQMSDERIEELMLDPASSATASSSRPPGAMPRPGWLDNPAEWLWSFVGGEPKINHFKAAAKCRPSPMKPRP